MSFFKCLVSFLIVPFTSVFLLKLSCPLRKLLLFKWNQSCFSFLAHTMFRRASKGSGHPPCSTLTVSKHNNVFLCKHLAPLKHRLSGHTSPSVRSVLCLPISCRALQSFRLSLSSIDPLRSYSHLSSLPALSGRDWTLHGDRMAAIAHFTEDLLSDRHAVQTVLHTWHLLTTTS